MPTVDEAWAAMHGPLQNLKENARTEPWDANRARLLDELDGNDPVVAELVRRLDELPDAERAELLATDELDALAYQVILETADPNPTADSTGTNSTAADPAGDDAAWADFLATNGPAWDGSAQSWPAFREWFAYHAAEAGLAAHATALLDYLESLAVSARVATLVDHYGVAIAQPTAESGREPIGGTAVTLDQQPEQQLTSAELLETSPTTSSSSSSEAEDLGPVWTALVARAPARWDGQAATWRQFRTTFLNAATTAGVEKKALEFLGQAESKTSDTSRFNYLRAFDLTKDAAAAPEDLSEHTPMLYRISGLKPPEILTEKGWGVNVYSAIFPTTVTPAVEEIKTLLAMTSQQGTGFLYRFPLDAASVAGFRYMNTEDTTIQRAIPAWNPDTMRLVEVICTETPDRTRIEVSVAGNWRLITDLGKK